MTVFSLPKLFARGNKVDGQPTNKTCKTSYKSSYDGTNTTSKSTDYNKYESPLSGEASRRIANCIDSIDKLPYLIWAVEP